MLLMDFLLPRSSDDVDDAVAEGSSADKMSRVMAKREPLFPPLFSRRRWQQPGC